MFKYFFFKLTPLQKKKNKNKRDKNLKHKIIHMKRECVKRCFNLLIMTYNTLLKTFHFHFFIITTQLKDIYQ